MHDFLILLEEDKDANSNSIPCNQRNFKIVAQDPANIQIPEIEIISSLCVPAYMKSDSPSEVFMFNTDDNYYYAYAFPFTTSPTTNENDNPTSNENDNTTSNENENTTSNENENTTSNENDSILFSIVLTSKTFRPALFMRFLFEVMDSFSANPNESDGLCRYGLALSLLNSWSTNDKNELIVNYPLHSESVSLVGSDLQDSISSTSDCTSSDEEPQTIITLNASRSVEGFSALLLKPLVDKAFRSLITNSGVLILAKTATVASCAAIALISLVTPLKYCDKCLLFTQNGDPRLQEALNNSTLPYKVVATIVSDTTSLIQRQRQQMDNYIDAEQLIQGHYSAQSNKQVLLRSLATCNAQSFTSCASFLSMIQPKSYSEANFLNDEHLQRPRSVTLNNNVRAPFIPISHDDTAEQLVDKIAAKFQTVVPIPDDDPRRGCAFYTPQSTSSQSLFNRTFAFLTPTKPKKGKTRNVAGFGGFSTSYSVDDIKSLDTYEEKVSITEKAARIRKYYNERLIKLFGILYSAMNQSVLTNPFSDILLCHVVPKVHDPDFQEEFGEAFIDMIQYTETFKSWRKKRIDRIETRTAFLSVPPKEAVAKVPNDKQSIELAENEVNSLLNRFARDQHLTTVLKLVQSQLKKKAKKYFQSESKSLFDMSVIDQMT